MLSRGNCDEVRRRGCVLSSWVISLTLTSFTLSLALLISLTFVAPYPTTHSLQCLYFVSRFVLYYVTLYTFISLIGSSFMLQSLPPFLLIFSCHHLSLSPPPVFPKLIDHLTLLHFSNSSNCRRLTWKDFLL